MGRKNRIKTKRRVKSIQRREIRRKMGKPVFFTLIHCHRPMAGFSNKYSYKATLYKVVYRRAKFVNVKWQASNITSCTFSGANLKGVDFYNSNLKNTSFTNAHFEDTVFFNCNLKNTNFSGATFKNVVFISTNVEVAKNLDNNAGYKIYRSYPKLQIEDYFICQLLDLSDFAQIFDPHVLHVNKSKLNYWTLQILLDEYGEQSLRALAAIRNRPNKYGFFTIYSYKKHIENHLKL